MSREIRRVPLNWQHPRAKEWSAQWNTPLTGYLLLDPLSYFPLPDQTYAEAWQEYNNAAKILDPDEDFNLPWLGKEFMYRPEFTEPASGYQIYETVSVGTPVSPVFSHIDEGVRWLMFHQNMSEAGAREFFRRGWVDSGHVDLTTGDMLINYQTIESSARGF